MLSTEDTRSIYMFLFNKLPSSPNSPECVEGGFSEVVKIYIQFTSNSHPILIFTHYTPSNSQPNKRRYTECM
jgi:hypothetical protein